MFDLENFAQQLQARDNNWKLLLAWIGNNLQESVDYYTLEMKGRKTKPTLSKAGAEKICGMLGVIVRFPNFDDYEKQLLSGVAISTVILRCELWANGQIVAEGVGARQIEKDFGDVNKCLKMAAKSAQIDATLRCAGISAIFTQDIQEIAASGYKGLTDIDVEELESLIRKVCRNFELDGMLLGFTDRLIAWYSKRYNNGELLNHVRDFRKEHLNIVTDNVTVFAQRMWNELPPTESQQKAMRENAIIAERFNTRAEAANAINQSLLTNKAKKVYPSTHGDDEAVYETYREYEHSQTPQSSLIERTEVEEYNPYRNRRG